MKPTSEILERIKIAKQRIVNAAWQVKGIYRRGYRGNSLNGDVERLCHTVKMYDMLVYALPEIQDQVHQIPNNMESTYPRLEHGHEDCTTCKFRHELRSHPWEDGLPMSNVAGYVCGVGLSFGEGFVTMNTKRPIGCELHVPKNAPDERSSGLDSETQT